jgi:hypothetical protein
MEYGGWKWMWWWGGSVVDGWVLGVGGRWLAAGVLSKFLVVK